VHGTVPLARRNSLADPRRLAASAVAVGLAIALILLLDGLWTGITRGVTAYEDNVGADLYVAQPGTHNFFGAVSQIPIDTLDTVRAQPGVEWAAPVRTFLSIVELHDRKIPTAIVGWIPGERGGPWVIAAGRAPQADDEVAIGRVMADRHGLEVGESIDMMGRTFRIVGTSSDTFMTSFVFMTHAATDSLLGVPGTSSFILVGTHDRETVRGGLAATGLAVHDRDELARRDLAVLTRAYKVPMGVMRIVAFAIGSLVVALSVYIAMMDRRREYGIIKAMGASRPRLLSIALRQTFIVAAAGLIAGALLFLAGRALITNVRPQFAVVATVDAAARAVGAALLMAVIAALLPARQLARLEPATAYRGG
jgi:putative ABC transport system permease protein